MKGYGALIGIILTVGLFVFAIVGLHYMKLNSREYVTDTVVRVERINSNNNSKYLIYGENEVYENTDDALFGKFNSSDLYAKIREGREYRFEVVGWRVQYWSMYRNILKVEEIE